MQRIKNIIISTGLSFKAKKQISPGVWSFSFTPDKLPDWKAGQHVVLFLKNKDGKRARRAFSVSSAPSEGVITITTRLQNAELSTFKQALKKLKKGDSLAMRGPIGKLVVDAEAQAEYAFFATGIGITPFRAILKEMAHQNQKNIVTLFFAGNKENHFFRDELSELNAKMPNLKIRYIYYPERLMGSTIQEQLGDNLLTTIFFLSGSSKMIKSYRRTLTGLGVSRRNIKSDTFIGLHSYGAPTDSIQK